jgi:hypothetical protein
MGKYRLEVKLPKCYSDTAPESKQLVGAKVPGKSPAVAVYSLISAHQVHTPQVHSQSWGVRGVRVQGPILVNLQDRNE